MDVDIDIFVGNNTLLDPEIYEMWLSGQQGDFIVDIKVLYLQLLNFKLYFMHFTVFLSVLRF